MPQALFHLFIFVLPLPPSLRSSSIRPGQYGYGRVPFSLPLHRTNRQARHTANGTHAATLAPPPAHDATRREEEEERADEEEPTEAPHAEATPAPGPAGSGPQHRIDRPPLRTDPGGARTPSSHTSSRSSSPPLQPNRQRFDWHSVTAPPPPVPHPRSSSHHTSHASSQFSTPLHRPGPVHGDQDRDPHPHPHPGFSQQVPPGGGVYPLQQPHAPHLGAESGRGGGRGAPQPHRCAGLEKEHRRCQNQVTSRGTSVLPEAALRLALLAGGSRWVGVWVGGGLHTEELGASKVCLIAPSLQH